MMMTTDDAPIINRIYVLSDPRTEEVRYVGVTIQSLQRRLCCHVGAAKRGEETHRSRWIRQLLSVGLRPAITLVEETTDRSRETTWILHYRQNGAKLTNATDGGDGLVNASLETRQKISVSMTQRHKTPEYQTRQREGIVKAWQSEEHRQRVIAANTGKKRSEESRKRISDSHVGHHWNKGAYKMTEDHKAKILAGRKAHGFKRGPHSEDTKRKMSIAHKGHTPSAATRALWSEQRKGVKRGPFSEQHIENLRKGHEKNKKPRSKEAIEKHRQLMLGRKHSEETKLKMSRTHKELWEAKKRQATESHD